MYARRVLYEHRGYNFSTNLKNNMEYDSHMRKLIEIQSRENRFLSKQFTSNTSFKSTMRNTTTMSISIILFKSLWLWCEERK
jgi:hypothetical protein